ncbi:MAG: nucleotidyl transferase AbiEii/AbiGii toxin family protein [Desulfotignum sp.]|nr:nucleotidyl transferase AbiEii/AbiGii toxin family protein [Desulfotignum sp.]
MTQWFEQISEWVYYESGIELPKALIRFDVYKNHRGGLSAQGKIGYKGPLRPGGDLPRIKLDLTLDEILVMPPVIKAVDHPYSDLPDQGIQINAYAFEEVFAEKIRALAERERPRDLYDVVCLYQQYGKDVDPDCIARVLRKKCVFKGIDFPTMENLKNRIEHQELEAEWGNMLAHQMAKLPEFDYFWKEIETVMTWLNRN